MTNSNNLIYLCKEVFDENSEPTQIEIEEQAFRLGIDPVKDFHLLSIARQCLLEPLPSNWFPCYIEKENKYFYYDKQSNTSQWEHPLDEYYRHIIEKTRSEDSSTGQDISLNIILEDNILDTMYQTKNKFCDKKSTTEKRTVRFKTPIEESLDLDNSDDNMKFLGPIKLNTPYTNSSTTLHNLIPFSTNNSTFDIKNTGSRSVFSKYNILPSKDELPKKSDLNENIKQINNDLNTSVNYRRGRENLRKIDITLTESSNKSESTSSEIRTDNLNSDYEVNDLKENNDIITTIQINKQQEKKDILHENEKSTIDNFNEFQPSLTIQLHNVKKDDFISDSGNSTEKDSKVMQSSIATNSFLTTKNKMAKITKQYPFNQSTNDDKHFSKIKSTEYNENMLEVKPPISESKFELDNHSINNEKQTLLDAAQIKIIIENHCDLIRHKLEDTLGIKENIFREEIIKKIDDIICKQTDNFEKHAEARHNELLSKNESELKNMQEKIENALIVECDKKYIKNISNFEQMCVENINKFQKGLDNYAEITKNKIQAELDVISNEFKKKICTKSGTVNDSWNQTLELYTNLELEKVKNNVEQTTENIKRDTDNEICLINLEFKEKLKQISKDKLNNATEQLDIYLREEIDLIKNRVSEKNQHALNINNMSNDKSNLCANCCPERELNPEYQTGDILHHKVNYSNIRKKIQHCSNELNDALKLINTISSSSEYTKEHNMDLTSNKCTVSCQTDNLILFHPKQNPREYIYPEPSNVPILNSLLDVNTKYADYWNQIKMSKDVYSHYMTPVYKQILSPLDTLNQEELKVNAAEQNICRLIETFNNFNHTDTYQNLNNHNIYQNKFTDIYQSLSPKQIAYNRTKHLREWLYKTTLEK